MGLNLGTFVGATQVREYVVGFDNRRRRQPNLIR